VIISGAPSSTFDTSWPQGSEMAISALGVGFGSPHRRFDRQLPTPSVDSAQAEATRRKLEAEARLEQQEQTLLQQAEALRNSDRVSLFSEVAFMAQSLAQKSPERDLNPSVSVKNSSLAAYKVAQNLIGQEPEPQGEVLHKNDSFYSGPIIDLHA
jgi:hypothetical protein